MISDDSAVQRNGPLVIAIDGPARHPVQTDAIAIRARRSLRSQADSLRAAPAARGAPAGPAAAAPSSRASGFARIRR